MSGGWRYVPLAATTTHEPVNVNDRAELAVAKYKSVTLMALQLNPLFGQEKRVYVACGNRSCIGVSRKREVYFVSPCYLHHLECERKKNAYFANQRQRSSDFSKDLAVLPGVYESQTI